MAGRSYTEPIVFKRATTVSDGAGGVEKTGDSVIYPCLATINEKQYPKVSDSMNPSFQNYYSILIWKDNQFEPIESDIIEFRSKKLAIQSISQNDSNDKYLINAISKR